MALFNIVTAGAEAKGKLVSLLAAASQRLGVQIVEVDIPVGGGSPAGPNTSIQINDGGSFGGYAGLVYDPVSGLFSHDAAGGNHIVSNANQVLFAPAGANPTFTVPGRSSVVFTGLGPSSSFNWSSWGGGAISGAGAGTSLGFNAWDTVGFVGATVNAVVQFVSNKIFQAQGNQQPGSVASVTGYRTIQLNAQGDPTAAITCEVGSVEALRLDALTAASKAIGYVLQWDGTRALWAPLGGTKGFDTTARVPSSQIGSSGQLYLVRFIAPQDMTAVQIGFLNSNTSAGDSYVMGVYNLALSSLLGTTAAFVPNVSGWDYRNFVSPFPLVGGVEYWAAIKGTNGSANFAISNNALSNANISRSAAIGGGALPASVGGSSPASQVWLGTIKGF